MLTFSHRPWTGICVVATCCENLCSGWKDQQQQLFFLGTNLFPDFVLETTRKTKNKTFRFSFWLQIISVHFWFSLRCTVFHLQLWHFYFSQGLLLPTIHFLFFSKLLESHDTHPVKAKAFVAFGKPRPTTNFMWLWSNLCYCWNRTEILSVGVPNRTNTTEHSQFNFTLRIFPCSLRKCAALAASMGGLYPFRASAFTTTIGFMFSLIFRKGSQCYALTPTAPDNTFNIANFALSLPLNFDSKFSTLWLARLLSLSNSV